MAIAVHVLFVFKEHVDKNKSLQQFLCAVRVLLSCHFYTSDLIVGGVYVNLNEVSCM